MSFGEVHAQYVGCPDGTEEERQRFPDLGWHFLSTLEPEEEDRQGEGEGEDDHPEEDPEEVEGENEE